MLDMLDMLDMVDMVAERVRDMGPPAAFRAAPIFRDTGLWYTWPPLSDLLDADDDDEDEDEDEDGGPLGTRFRNLYKPSDKSTERTSVRAASGISW